MNKKIAGFACLMLFYLHLSAQKSNLYNTVILYNVVPLRVDLNPDGSILTIYGEDNTFLKGYTVVRPKKEELQENDLKRNLDGYQTLDRQAYDLVFDPGKATLNQATITAIDKAIDFSFFDGDKIVLNSYKLNTQDSRALTLYKNRMNALLTYLEIKNVDKDKIIVNLDEIENSNEAFKITFVK